MSNPITAEIVLRKVWDEDSQALRTIPSTETEFSVALDKAEDSVTTQPSSLSVTDDTEVDATGIKSVCLYLFDDAVAASAKIQVSPVDTGDFWMDVATSTVTNDPSDIKASSVLTICAKRVRVEIVTGAPDFVLIGQAI